jgi:hypothetical protein
VDPLDYGTLYQTLTRAAAKWGNQTAYGVPPMAGRSYYPQGVEYSWAETLAQAEAYKAVYARAPAMALATGSPSCSTSARSSYSTTTR